MAEHLTKELIDQYQTGSLSAQERFDCDIHFADCQACQEQVWNDRKLEALSSFVQTRLSIIASESSDHLTFEQMADYVDNKIDQIDSECIDSHLIWCELCSAEVKEMVQQNKSFSLHSPSQFSLPSNSQIENVTSLWKWSSRKPWISKEVAIAAFVAVLFSGGYALLRFWRTSDGAVKSKAQITASEIGKISADASPNPTRTLPGIEKPFESPQVLPTSTLDFDGGKWLLPTDHRLFSATLKTGRLDVPLSVKEMLRKDIPMGKEDLNISFKLFSPADETVRETQPILKWQAFADDSKYKVVVTDLTSNKNVIDRLVNATDLKLNVPLESGHLYRWQVSAKDKDDKTIYGKYSGQSYADFFLIDRNELNLVLAAEKRYSDEKDPLARLALAVRYAKAGLLKDSERELNSFLKAAPKSPHIPQAQKLLKQLKSMNSR